jgi:Effector-associated domain 1
MNIDGQKRREIRRALLEAFPMPNDLRMVTDNLTVS